MIQQPTTLSKLTHVLSNIHLLPVLYHPDILLLQSFISTPSILDTPPFSTKIHTYYLLTQPALCSLHWQQPYEQNKYPVALVICHKLEQMEQFGVSLKFITWIQSGGVRCIGLKNDISDSDIQKWVKLSHCAVFVDVGGQGGPAKNFINRFLEIAHKQVHYPILFVGNSGLYAMESLSNLSTNSQRRQEGGLGQIYIEHQSKLFKGLELSLRLQFQNRKKHAFPMLKLPVSEISKGFQISSIMQIKNKNLACTIEHEKDIDIFCIFVDPCLSEVPQNIQLWHCAIINFVNLCKKEKKEIDEKKVDKNLIANNKIVYRGQKGYYLFQ